MECKELHVKIIFSIFMAVWDVGAPVETEGVSQSTPVMKAKTGTAATLECFVPPKRVNDPLVWYKQSVGQMPLVLGTAHHFVSPILYGEFNNSRFSIHKGSGLSHLSISNIQLSDEASYYCGVRIVYDIHFGNGTYLFVEEKDQLRSTDVIQVALSGPIYPGDSETLECVVLANSTTEDLRVFWFRPASGGSHPGVIYTNKSWTGPCDDHCVYSLPKKDVNISDAGTYYCGIATSGQILFGNGTSIVIADPVDTVLVGLVVALGCCVTLMLFLVWLNCQRRVTCDTCKMRDLQLVRDGSSNSTQRSGQMHLDDVIYTMVIYNIKTFKSQRK
ncbi:uncharacterized protein LOC121681665 [Alosa sapidissima]|uniref:uncharacterized protein LOC121681665 n=1 Tax=Alosa sapidissima TaxID=34773 RepID=UPI001C082771|nr:uncharacterized protein LOC121681665 [Alosa sapidissima]